MINLSINWRRNSYANKLSLDGEGNKDSRDNIAVKRDEYEEVWPE